MNREKIFQAIGQASLCWYPAPSGIFDSEQAIKIAEQLCHDLAKENANSGYPLLADVGELIRITEIFTDYVDANADKFNQTEREMIIDIETQLEKVRANVS